MRQAASFVERRAPSLALFLALILAACGGDSTGPSPLSGRYALTSYDGAPLPIILGSSVSSPPRGGGTSIHCDNALVGSTLAFIGATVVLTDNMLQSCDDGSTPVSTTNTQTGTQRAAGDTVVISLPGSPIEIRLYARRQTNGLVVTRREYLDQFGGKTTDGRSLVFTSLP